MFTNLKYDTKGLIPAIIQDYSSGTVLMQGYMNRESLELTIKTGEIWFFSRSRGKLWHKGEISGNVLKVKDIRVDCDGDCLLFKVEPKGPTCHTGEVSCFHLDLEGQDKECRINILKELYLLIKDRKDNPKDGSYTNMLFEKGRERILKKIGEEAVEVILAAQKNNKDETLWEISDLIYHLLVLIVEMDITPDEIELELAKRRK